MKNVFKLFGLAALVAVIVFAVSASFTACDTGGGGGGGVTADKLVLPAGQAWLTPKRAGSLYQSGYQFRADGTAVALDRVSTPDDRSIDYWITGNYEWEIDDGRLYMRTPPSVFQPQAGAWSNRYASIRGNTLTFDQAGNPISFTPQTVNIVR
jgi:hypothetical protein